MFCFQTLSNPIKVKQMFGYGCVQKVNKVKPKNLCENNDLISPANETDETQSDNLNNHSNMLVSIQKQQIINNAV